jgi:hypothetical protein
MKRAKIKEHLSTGIRPDNEIFFQVVIHKWEIEEYISGMTDLQG